jgi:hypothetical protein
MVNLPGIRFGATGTRISNRNDRPLHLLDLTRFGGWLCRKMSPPEISPEYFLKLVTHDITLHFFPAFWQKIRMWAGWRMIPNFKHKKPISSREPTDQSQ